MNNFACLIQKKIEIAILPADQFLMKLGLIALMIAASESLAILVLYITVHVSVVH